MFKIFTFFWLRFGLILVRVRWQLILRVQLFYLNNFISKNRFAKWISKVKHKRKFCFQPEHTSWKWKRNVKKDVYKRAESYLVTKQAHPLTSQVDYIMDIWRNVVPEVFKAEPDPVGRMCLEHSKFTKDAENLLLHLSNSCFEKILFTIKFFIFNNQLNEETFRNSRKIKQT